MRNGVNIPIEVKRMEKILDLQLFATTVPVQPSSANSFDYSTTDRDTGTNFGKLLEPTFRKLFFET
jgi:hypothetical protein